MDPVQEALCLLAGPTVTDRQRLLVGAALLEQAIRADPTLIEHDLEVQLAIQKMGQIMLAMLAGEGALAES